MGDDLIVRVGQFWQEVDPRYPDSRLRGVVGFAADGRVILSSDGTTRTTKASRDRFNGKRGGYRLITDVQP